MAIDDPQEFQRAVVQGYHDGVLCLATIDLVERANRAAVIDPLNEANAGMAAQLLLDGALFRLHLVVARAFAPARRSDDAHLRAVIQQVAKPEMIADPFDVVRIREAVDLFRELEADRRCELLKVMRDKMLAHLTVYNPSIKIAKYEELFGFARDTCRIWDLLAVGTGAVPQGFADEVDGFRDSAGAFWSRWETA